QTQLVQEDPGDVNIRCDLARTLSNLGLSLHRAGREDDARDVLRAGVASLREGLEHSPQAGGSLRWLMNGQYVNLSLVERAAGRPDDSVGVTLDRLNACAPDADEFYRGAL